MITTSKFARSWCAIASTISLDYHLKVYFQIPSITTCKCISKLAGWRPQSVSLGSFDGHLQVQLELRLSTAWTQSRYILCRWVATDIHRYIDTYIHRWKYNLNAWVLTVLERSVVAVISRCTSSIPKEDVLRWLLNCDLMCSRTCCWPSETCRWRCENSCWRSEAFCRHTQICHRCSQTCRQLSQVLPGAPKVLSGSLRCSQTYHNHSHGTPNPIISDLCHCEGRPKCPPSVWYTPESDASKFTLRILSDTSGDF